MVPFMSPRTIGSPNAFLDVCQLGKCKRPGHAAATLGDYGVRHGDYCNGSTPPWECHLVLRLLSPGLLMREISEECRSVVFASGSLASLPSLCFELNPFGKGQSSSSSASQSPLKLSQQQQRPSSSQPSFSQPSAFSQSPPKLVQLSSSSSSTILPQSLLESLVNGAGNGVVLEKKKYTNRLQTTPKPLEANHVVDLQKQLFAVSIGNFPSGEKLTVSYSHYKNPSFFPKFGHAVASVIESIPRGGCLIFFPSYSFLNKCVSCWNPAPGTYNNNNNYFNNNLTAPDVWDRLIRSKGKVVVEPTGSQEDFESARDLYKNTIQETGSCILLAVFRGKMSEGISFNDDNARAVICIGMPYPNYNDRGVKAKQAYNDEQRKLRKKTCLLPGSEFYAQQAYRAIAQALGRCIRHGADYGTVILMDSRHCDDGSPNTNNGSGSGGNGSVCRAHANLPKWMRASVRTLSMNSKYYGHGHGLAAGKKLPILGGYGGLQRELRQFFAQAPVVAQAVRDKWKLDLEKMQDKKKAATAGGVHVFNRETGNWTAVVSTTTTTTNSNDNKEDKKELTPRNKSMQI